MPRCFMAKKWKQIAYEKDKLLRARESAALTQFNGGHAGSKGQENFNTTSTKTNPHSGNQWGPSSPTEGATAPSPPPSWLPAPTAGKVTVLFNGYLQETNGSGEPTSPVQHQEERNVTNMDSAPTTILRTPSRYSRFGCLPPPKKRELYRPYCLPESIMAVEQEKLRLQSVCSTLFERRPEDLTTAHAILDLSTSSPLLLPPTPPASASSSPTASPSTATSTMLFLSSPPSTPGGPASNTMTFEAKSPSLSDSGPPSPSTSSSTTPPKTVSYTYEAFFVSDGRSKKKGGRRGELHSPAPPKDPLALDKYSGAESDSESCPSISGTSKTRYTCSECGKHYATSSNLSRHKQTHRSLDSQSAKRCPTCGKAYVSMPALAMHILTHSLHHKCGVCGKAFSRPWLLQGHMRSHTGEKPYGCAHCGKAFADRSNLRAHMQTHSAAKNYSCRRCNKSFALKSYLNKHYDSACFKDSPAPSDDESCCAEFEECEDVEIDPGPPSVPSVEVFVEITTS